MKKQTFAELFNSARATVAYKVQGVIIEITEQIVEKMNAMGMSKSELASKIDASAPYVTKLLRGKTNFTAESIVKVADALNCDVEVKLVPRSSNVDWIELMGKTVEAKREFRVWSQIKDETRSHRDGLKFIQPPTAPQLFYHESH
jgi:transcriptional regulator with XRE-family HTH domain